MKIANLYNQAKYVNVHMRNGHQTCMVGKISVEFLDKLLDASVIAFNNDKGWYDVLNDVIISETLPHNFPENVQLHLWKDRTVIFY